MEKKTLRVLEKGGPKRKNLLVWGQRGDPGGKRNPSKKGGKMGAFPPPEERPPGEAYRGGAPEETCFSLGGSGWALRKEGR